MQTNLALSFADRLIIWQAQAGRHHLPWQKTQDPYRVWVSEVMLQQTQVAAVLAYYQRFMKLFPTVYDLANATEEEVLAQWAGLGYYSRGRNLHRAAQVVVNDYLGHFPQTSEGLMALPGIGRSTAAAIASFCFNERVAILDGNVKRVLARHAGIQGFPGDRIVELQLWEEATARLPDSASDMPAYTQGMMDFGATLCKRTKPLCGQCPLNSDCIAFNQHKVHELPTPRPSKIIPERFLQILIISISDHMMLEYRTRSGVWKGLWSFPELEAQTSEKDIYELLDSWGLKNVLLQWGETFSHTFSHYRLYLKPCFVTVASFETDAVQHLPKNYAWKKYEELAEIGLPAPIRKCVQNFLLQNNNDLKAMLLPF
ncbi:MAG: A/G-specific adenine glycosylase [Pseudomonadota bacterium]